MLCRSSLIFVLSFTPFTGRGLFQTKPSHLLGFSPSSKPSVNHHAPSFLLSSNLVLMAESVAIGDTSTLQLRGQSASEVNQVEESEKSAAAAPSSTTNSPKWPGWPGYNVFRLIVPVLKVGSIIGRKGELIKRICEETGARIRVLDAPVGTPDRVVLVSGKEELDVQLSPAMDALLRVFKRVTGLGEGGSEADGAAFCSIRLLVASTQAISLIGKQGSTIKSIQESSGAVVRILSDDELPSYATSEERIVEMHGESLKVQKALEAVAGHLRKFLVDHSMISVIEKNFQAAISQDRAADAWSERSQSLPQHVPLSQTLLASDLSLSLNRDPYFNHESVVDTKRAPTVSLFGQDNAAGLRSGGLSRPAAPIVTQVTQTMQVPLSYAEDIIGIGGANIAYIRRTSGATLTVQESGGRSDEITVEIRGNSTQVQTAEQLIQEFITGHKEQPSSAYGKVDSGLGSYSQLADSSYRPSSYSTNPLGGYGSSGVGGYSSYRF